jgi:hypothetical protein
LGGRATETRTKTKHTERERERDMDRDGVTEIRRTWRLDANLNREPFRRKV